MCRTKYDTLWRVLLYAGMLQAVLLPAFPFLVGGCIDSPPLEEVAEGGDLYMKWKPSVFQDWWVQVEMCNLPDRQQSNCCVLALMSGMFCRMSGPGNCGVNTHDVDHDCDTDLCDLHLIEPLLPNAVNLCLCNDSPLGKICDCE